MASIRINPIYAAVTHYHTSLGDGTTTVLSIDTVKKSVAEGYQTTASGEASHAEGESTTASGYCSHAEGYNTTANDRQSHAEGNSTTAGRRGHAEGYYTTSSGENSHAEGNSTTASGNASHTQNTGTIARGDSQTVLGKYNVEDVNGTYAAIIGNGTDSNARSNALAVDWNGCTYINNSNITRDAVVSTNEWDDMICLCDSQGAPVGYLRIPFNTSNQEGVQLETKRMINGAYVYNGIQMYIDNAGVRSVAVSDPAAWRTALDVPSASHTHTKSQITDFGSYLPLSGGAMTGGISWNSAQRLYWKEGSYGDQFAIQPAFSGADDANLLKIQGAVGAIDTQPALYDLMTLSGKSGNAWLKGSLQAAGNVSSTNGFLVSTKNGNTVTIGSQNDGYCHFNNSKAIPFWFNQDIQMEHGKKIGGSNNYGPTAIELTPVSNAGHGGYIDFHFNHSSADFTSRIIEDASGRLNMNASNGIILNGMLKREKPGGISYIAGMTNAGIHVNKAEGNIWYPMVSTRTKGGGGWAIGNYNDETLEFVYGTKANINAGTNSTTEAFVITSDGKAIAGGTELSKVGHHHSIGVAVDSASAKNSSAIGQGVLFGVNVTLPAKAGYIPFSVVCVDNTAASGYGAYLLGFDLDGLSTGGTPVVKTRWKALGPIQAQAFTVSVQVVYLKVST